MVVTKLELMKAVQKRFPDMPSHDVAYAVHLIFDSMANAIAAEERIELRNFGVFSVRRTNPRMGRNPKTGESIRVEARNVPVFKPGKNLKELVDA